MEGTPPVVSVIIPTYNQARFVAQAIASVLNQTFRDYEIIVINDGSTDDTAAVLASFGDCVKVITQENAGLSRARNRGLRAARGELIGLLDSDDLWEPDGLRQMVSCLRANAHLGLVCGAWNFVREDGEPITHMSKPSSIRANAQGTFFRTLALRNLFPSIALLVREACFQTCGLFDETLEALEDWDMWLRMAHAGFQLGTVDAPFAHYRRHSGNMSLDLHRMEMAYERLFAKLFNDSGVADDLEDLRGHMQMYKWLDLAAYAIEAGLQVDADRLFESARGCYETAPADIALSKQYLGRVGRYPSASPLCAAVVERIPSLSSYYEWTRFRGAVHGRTVFQTVSGCLQMMLDDPVLPIRMALGRLFGA